MRKYPKHLPQPDKHWLKGDKGYICYSYTAAGVTVVPVVVERREPPHYLSVLVPSMLSDLGGEFAKPFGCLCWEHQVYATKEKAEQVAAELNAQPRRETAQ